MKVPSTNKCSSNQSRRGLAIPMIIGVVTVFSILVLVLSRATTESYTQTALANYNLHARLHAMATIEFITSELHRHLCDAVEIKPWKKELIDVLLKQQPSFTINMMERIDLTKQVRKLMVGGGVGDPTNPGGFRGGDRVRDHSDEKLKEKDKFEILKAEVKFHNFRPIRFDTFTPGIYNDPTRYYHHPIMEPGGIAPIGDLFGFYTIHVKVRFGFVERELLVTRDAKIINNEPIARNFAVFAMGPPNAQYMQNDLNQGGNFTIMAQNKGRIRIQGPYIINTEGYPDGSGGTRPVGLSFPEKKWNATAFVPSPRGISTNSSLFSGVNVERPRKASGNGISLGLGPSTGLNLTFGGDPGLHGKPDVQEYWAATKKVGKQNFSISGSRQSFNGWKGLKIQEGKANSAVIGVFQGNPGELEKSTEARIEGDLFANFNQMYYAKTSKCLPVSTIISGFMAMGDMFSGNNTSSTGTAGGQNNASQGASSLTSNEWLKAAMDMVQLCWINYKVDKKGTVPYYYGLHSPYTEKIDKLESLLVGINEVMSSFQTAGKAQGGGIISAVGNSLKQSTDRLKQADLTRNQISGDIKPYDERWAPDLFGVLPTNFKKFERTAARKYESLDDHFKIHKRGGKTRELFLDGNIWVNELSLNSNITYFGKGTLISAYTPGSLLFTATKQAKIRDLKPAQSGRDHLNLFYRNSNAAESGGGLLKMNGDFEGSLYAYQGVLPDGSDIRIKGNLIVEIFNKSRSSEGQNLTVEYNPNYLEADNIQYDWFTVSLSPKISGLGYNFRTRANQAGPGEDGVQVIMSDLGE